MDPCMGALPDTSASAYRHRSHTEDRKTAGEERQIKKRTKLEAIKRNKEQASKNNQILQPLGSSMMKRDVSVECVRYVHMLHGGLLYVSYPTVQRQPAVD